MEYRVRCIIFAGVTLCLCGLTSCQDSVRPVTGDVILGAMYEVNDLEGGKCGDFRISNLQSIVAITWFLDRLNNDDFVPGINIGLEVYRTCKMTERAAVGTLMLLNNYTMGEATPSGQTLFGMLGPSRTADAMVVSRLIASLPARQRPVQISGSSTGRQLSDKSLYPNFFRVIPPDNVQVQVMLQLLEQLDWNYVAIVYDDDDYGRSAATELRTLAEDKQICVPVFEGLPPDTGTSAFNTRAKQIASEMRSRQNGLVRGMVVLASTSTTKELLRAVSNDIRFVSLILSEAIQFQASALQTSANVPASIARGALVTSPQYLDLPEFRDFWNQLWKNWTVFSDHAAQNPWLEGYLRQAAPQSSPLCGTIFDCWSKTADHRSSLSVSEGSNGDHLSIYQWYELKAAGAFVSLLKQLQAEKCPRINGLCPDLRAAIANRTTLQSAVERGNIAMSPLSSALSTFASVSNLTFDANGNERKLPGDIQYTVYNFQQDNSMFSFKQVGNVSQDVLSINTGAVKFYSETGDQLPWSQRTSAQCDVNHDCAQCEHDVSSDVIFIEGDFYVVAIGPINARDTDDTMKCGEIRQLVGADIAAAVVFAVKQVNMKSGLFKDVLPNKRVGLLVINSCTNPLLVKQRLLDLYSDRLPLPGGKNTSSLVPNIMGYIGDIFSDSSIAAADTLTGIDKTFVQVSPGSTATELKDRKKYPYFMRLVPADDIQAKVLLEVIVRLKANYVQIIYDPTTAYATGLYHAVQAETNSGHYNVCIAQAIPVTPRASSGEYAYIVDKLRAKSSARVVIIFQFPDEIEKTLAAILQQALARDGFIFMGTDTWGGHQELIDNRPQLEGSLVLTQEVRVDVDFERDFKSLNPTDTENPWLKYFWETRAQCYFDRSFLRSDKKNRCFDDYAHDYVQDAMVALSVKSVYALILGFYEAFKTHCGQNNAVRCDALTSPLLVEAMKRVQMDLYNEGRNTSVFNSNGDGLVGFKVLQVTRDRTSVSGNVAYTDVGRWTELDGLTLRVEDLQVLAQPGFTSVCPNDFECSACFNHTAPITSTQSQAEASTGVDVGVPVGLSVAFIIIIIGIIVFFVIVFRRQRSTQSGASTQSLIRGVVLRRSRVPLPPLFYVSDEMGDNMDDGESLYDKPDFCASSSRNTYLTPVAERVSRVSRRPVCSRRKSF